LSSFSYQPLRYRHPRQNDKAKNQEWFVGVFDVRGTGTFFGWYMVEQDLVDIEEAGHEIPLPIRLGGSGEQRVVNCQRGLGQSPGQKRIWCILFGTEPIWWKKNSVCLLMTILAQINHIHFIKLHNNDIIILS